MKRISKVLLICEIYATIVILIVLIVIVLVVIVIQVK